MSDPVHVDLTSDEAIVLFDFLSRFSETDTLTIADRAEQKTLWNLLGLLEKQLIEPFLPDYQGVLQQARDRLRDPTE